MTAWTKNIFETRVAHDPAIGREALKCVQSFLLQRNAIVDAAAVAAESSTVDKPVGNQESQDSLDMFDDEEFDFEDPALGNLLGEAQAARASSSSLQDSSQLVLRTRIGDKDRSLAKVINESVSPALFHLVSSLFNSDRTQSKSLDSRITLVHQTMEQEELDSLRVAGPFRIELQNKLNLLLKSSSLRNYAELVVDCWVGCSNVLVKNELREWSSYLRDGNESFKKIIDPESRRNLGLRLAQNILLLDPDSLSKNIEEFVVIWFSTIGDKSLSIQNLFTESIINPVSRGTIVHPFLKGFNLSPSDSNQSRTNATLETTSSKRLEILKKCFQNMSTINESSKPPRALIYSCLSALFSTLRQSLNDSVPSVFSAQSPTLSSTSNTSGTPTETARKRKDEEYIKFCAEVERVARECLGPNLLRGAGAELDSLAANVRKKREELGAV